MFYDFYSKMTRESAGMWVRGRQKPIFNRHAKVRAVIRTESDADASFFVNKTSIHRAGTCLRVSHNVCRGAVGYTIWESFSQKAGGVTVKDDFLNTPTAILLWRFVSCCWGACVQKSCLFSCVLFFCVNTVGLCNPNM